MKKFKLPSFKKAPAPTEHHIPADSTEATDTQPSPTSSPAMKKALPFVLMGGIAAVAGGYMMLQAPQDTTVPASNETASFTTTQKPTDQNNTRGTLIKEETSSASNAEDTNESTSEVPVLAGTADSSISASGIATNPGGKRIRNPFAPEEKPGNETSSTTPQVSSAAGFTPTTSNASPTSSTPSMATFESPAVLSSVPSVTAPPTSTSRSSSSSNRGQNSTSSTATPITPVPNTSLPPAVAWTSVPETPPVSRSRMPDPEPAAPVKAWPSPSTVLTPVQAPNVQLPTEPVTTTLLPAENAQVPPNTEESESGTAAKPDVQVTVNQAQAFVAENGISLGAQAQGEDGKSLMLNSHYGPVYVDSGDIIPGTKAKVTAQDKQTVKITVGKDSILLKLGN